MTPRSTGIARVGLALYTLALLVATHWPGAKIEVDIPRPDLYVHAAIYGVLTSLCIAAAPLGRPRLRRRAIFLCALAAAVLGGLDELTQPLPPFHRDGSLDDYAADLTGIGVAVAGAWLVALVLSRMRGRPNRVESPDKVSIP